MSKYAAEIIDSGVTRILVTESVAWLTENLGGEWIECKVDGSIRGCYPGIGYTYDRVNDLFLPPPAEPEGPPRPETLTTP